MNNEHDAHAQELNYGFEEDMAYVDEEDLQINQENDENLPLVGNQNNIQDPLRHSLFKSIKEFIIKHPFFTGLIFIFILIIITGILIFFIRTSQIKQIAVINSVYIIARDRPDFQPNYAYIKYLGIYDKLIILNGASNFSTNVSSNVVMTQNYLFRPFGDKQPYQLLVGYGLSVVNHNHSYYQTTFSSDFKNGTEINDIGLVPKNITKIYTGGFYYVLSKYGKTYITTNPNDIIILNMNELSFFDKLKVAVMLIHQYTSNLVTIYL